MTAIAPTPTNTSEDQGARRFADVVRYNIRRYMRLTGKLQRDLAKTLGITRPAVTLLLNGSSKIKIEQMYLAARALGVQVSDLIDDTYYRQDEEFMSRMHETEAGYEKAPEVNSGASDGLLRLGLNQRPSD